MFITKIPKTRSSVSHVLVDMLSARWSFAFATRLGRWSTLNHMVGPFRTRSNPWDACRFWGANSSIMIPRGRLNESGSILNKYIQARGLELQFCPAHLKAYPSLKEG